MKKESGIRVMNSCVAILKNLEGEVIKECKNVNITCNIGRQSLCSRLIDNIPETSKLGVIQIMGIGDGLSSTSENDLALENELERVQIDLSTATINGTVITVNATFPTGLEATISEAGVFTDSTALVGTPDSGSLLAHSRFSNPIQKLSTQTLTIIWTISILNTI